MHPDVRYYSQPHLRYRKAVIAGIKARLSDATESACPYKKTLRAYGGTVIQSPFYLAWLAGFDFGSAMDIAELEGGANQ